MANEVLTVIDIMLPVKYILTPHVSSYKPFNNNFGSKHLI